VSIASTVLILDDCATDREAYRRYLVADDRRMYQIVESESAEEGLALCQRHHFDGILLDFRLPDMSGLEFLGQLKQLQDDIAVIMLTAYGDEALAVQAIKGGAQDYLTKQQLSPEILRQTLNSALHQASLQQQLMLTQERQRLISAIALRVRQSLDLDQTLQTSVQEVRRLLRCDRTLIYQFAPTMSGQVVSESVGSGWSACLGRSIEDSYFQRQGAKEYQQGRKQVMPNIVTAGLTQCHQELLEQFEVKAALIVPMLLSDYQTQTTELWGLLVAHQCSGPRLWSPEEIETLEELSGHLTLAIQHAELLAQTQSALVKEQQLNRFKSQMMAMVSHEYQSPLAAIQTAASTFNTHQGKLNKVQQQRLMTIIEEKTRHLSGMVSKLLLVNQMELQKIHFHSISFDLKQFLEKIVEDHQQIAGEDYRIFFTARGKDFPYSGDLTLLRQAFDNILANAVKYSPDGGSISIHLQATKSALMVDITDEGIGIPPTEIDALCQSFSRASNVSHIPGIGLGLVIVKTAIELHGGQLHLESPVANGQGTKVRVVFPYSGKIATDGVNPVKVNV
jgi:signal transduction histidine kinase/DNA-binding NarL/FixJ family response regulator